MKIGKLFLLILIAAALVYGAAMLYQSEYSDQRDAGAALARGDKLFPDLRDQVESIDKIEYQKTTDSVIALTRNDEGVWVVSSHGGYPADPSVINRLILEELPGMKVADILTDNPEKYDRFGLDSAFGENGTIRLFDKESETIVEVKLGEERSVESASMDSMARSGGRYLLVPEFESVLMVDADMWGLGEDVQDWVKREFMSVPSEEIVSVDIDHGSTESLSIRWDENDDPQIIGMSQDMEIESSEVSQVRGALNGLRLTDVLPAGSDEANELEQGVTYTAKSKDGTVYTVKTYQAEGEDDGYISVSAEYDTPIIPDEDDASTEVIKTAREEAEAAEKAVPEFNEKHGEWLYQISSFPFKKFSKKLSDATKDKVEEEDAEPEDEAPPIVTSSGVVGEETGADSIPMARPVGPTPEETKPAPTPKPRPQPSPEETEPVPAPKPTPTPASADEDKASPKPTPTPAEGETEVKDRVEDVSPPTPTPTPAA